MERAQKGSRGRAGQDGADAARKRTSIKKSIADAVVTKNEDVFLLTEQDGSIPLDREHGLGLYYHDCRFLGGYQLTLSGERPNALAADAARGFAALHELTNAALRLPGGRLLAPQRLAIRLDRVIAGRDLAVHEVVTVRSHAEHPVSIQLGAVFQSEFEDIFALRGMAEPAGGGRRRFEAEGGALRFSHEGGDGVLRTLAIQLSPAPDTLSDAAVTWRLDLDPQQEKRILICFSLGETTSGKAPEPAAPPDLAAVVAELHRSADEWMGAHTGVRSASGSLEATAERSLVDLRLLRNRREGHEFFSGGVPWYATLFGRDSLLAALSTLAFEPRMAEATLRLLAARQGTEDDAHRDEEPGKILHELRVGELSRMHRIPFTPYYGTVDASPLFLVLLARHASWSGKLDVFHDLESNVDRALAWITGSMDRSPDGYLRYQCRSKQGLRNQGWKDSGDGIVMSDGSLAEPPIALSEVQGYVYRAFTDLASLFERAGRPSSDLRRRAEALRVRFERDFWLEEEGVYALALQGDGAKAAVVTSNAGQVLWSGIADPERAVRTASRLMQPDMWSGWGVRTLSTHERRYNPIGYHLGTVWPHDNALIAAGFRRYGRDEDACRLFQGLLDVAGHFTGHRLPELFCGFARDDVGLPVRYPVACHPQAWAAGSVPLFLDVLLGLAPDAFARRLRIVRPRLPASVPDVELSRMRVGDARVSLRFARRPDGGTDASVLSVEGRLDVEVEA
jgi:glycogen debranching enzyme